MKNLILLTVLALNLNLKAINGNNKFSNLTDDTATCLSLKGKISNAMEGDTKNCKVELLTADGVVEEMFIDKSNKFFRFKLARDTHYAVRVSKKGYVTKLISINTSFPSDVVDVCEFSFNTELISEEESESLNKDALDFPIAIIHFDNKTEQFTYNKEYTINIKREIYMGPFESNNKAYATAD